MQGAATRYSIGHWRAFPRSVEYREWVSGTAVVKEPSVHARLFPFSERHIQCVWFDPRLRPARLHTEHGEPVCVEEPGIWNLESGPDFTGAVLRVGPHLRQMKGDVELHIYPRGWLQHHHQNDPKFNQVRFHVTWFPGTLPEDVLPPGALQISLRSELNKNPGFSLETVDTTAYPYGTRAHVPPCSMVLTGWHPDRKQAILEAAGEERIRRKTERMGIRIEEAGMEQALYEELFTSLGYKHNKNAFRRLAQLVPFTELQKTTENDPTKAFGILIGVAGLIPEQSTSSWDSETRAYFRKVWDAWWKARAPWENRRMSKTDWHLSGLRPANHPIRRIMAAAQLFSTSVPLATTWQNMAGRTGENLLGAANKCLRDLPCEYWPRRLSFGGKRQQTSIALLGPARIHSILVNVFVPFLGAALPTDKFDHNLLDHLPIEDDNHIVRRTAYYLFGPNHPPSLYQSGLRRQGLIQIFHDFCLNDRSRCAICTFPKALRQYQDT